MKLENEIFGSLSFSFFIGYLTLILSLILLFSAKTPVYSEVALSVNNIPLSTILLASPLAVIIGIIVNCIRCSINKYILHRPIYALESVTDDYREIIIPIISSIFTNNDSVKIELHEKSFQDIKTIIVPKFDEYSIKSRWIHDFLDTTIYISIVSILIVSFRALINSFSSIELYTFLVMSVSALFAFLSLKDLQIKYTKAELAVIVKEYSRKSNLSS